MSAAASTATVISLDDGYAPSEAVEQTRRLMESDKVALIFFSISAAHNTAITNICRARTFRNCSLAPAPRNSPACVPVLATQAMHLRSHDE
jgi:hypothetical protein